MLDLSSRKGQILVFIKGYVDLHGYAPSYQEICDYMGIKSKSTVHHYMKLLMAEGRLETDLEGICSRGFRVAGYKPKLRRR